jgi:hypothetical protein
LDVPCKSNQHKRQDKTRQKDTTRSDKKTRQQTISVHFAKAGKARRKGQDTTGYEQTRQDRTKQKQDRTRHAKTRQDKTKIRQGKARLDKKTQNIQDKPGFLTSFFLTAKCAVFWGSFA